MLNNAAPSTRHEQTERIDNCLDPASFTYLKANMYREHQNVLNMVKVRQPHDGDGKYLDLGCGPGNFLKEVLLPRLRPCKCVVAVDSSPQMLSYARQHYHAPEVSFDILDIENGNPREI
ncbi:hypothetical protein HPB51_023970 [Rhipicephalus microplus]|uniref:Methyltransferase domain-containing protein n=1 Tax=Rhipicephalus microplus TaxID=6941 RepID=A0A9J6DJW0_RHIMP|nr:hypothetical protein HPB51_023970 [Rhipicephalus microplus]